ncbi:hypothetical protein A3A60_02240 [Candidatus Curtissbacteria bacterium RIFCSPLOWO2_01_FULL_42_26]|uniref:Double zinc ribbon domain-containing protein n=1 Tax=Candidatus Curtissbacteria bacterium RIFCSPLOWO2_01_FULL_42_26 TaxID=1797729 RepID=A0A1F5HZ47_9BACT|nr:MAG: hypothetical protein A3A60_02240 [Candidatus Curtissbacteria bacterium RIFCSPLOWO2_01_FULL_42_26]
MFNLLDLIFPKRCVSCGRIGSYLCGDCLSRVEFVDKPVCPVCQRQAIEGRVHPGCGGKYRLDGLVVACRYRGPVKRAITKVKYKWIYDIEKVFVDLLVKNLWRFDLPKDAVLVPVPLHFKRRRWRGFNQAEILAKHLATTFKVTLADILERSRATKTQVGLTRDERRDNVRGAFSLHPSAILSFAKRHPELDLGSFLKERDVILVDDVFTSGATTSECAKVLKRAGAKSVWAMAVALG